MKLAKYYFFALICFSLIACGTVKKFDIEEYIGLYEIVSADCEVAGGSFDPCKNTYFFELLKGQFIGIDDDDIAYIFWSGYPEIDSELQYTSHLITNHATQNVTDGKFWLNKDQEIREYLIFRNGTLSEYYVEYSDKSIARKIKYTLRPVRRGSKPSYRMNYPGNE